MFSYVIKVRQLFYGAASLVLMAAVLIGCMADEVGGVYIVSGEADVLQSVANQVTTTYFNAGGKWTAASTVDWLEVTPSSGEGGRNAIVITSRKPNRTMQERTGVVVITSDGKSQEVVIRQRDECALFEQKEYLVGPEGGVVNMAFTSNIERGTLMISYMILDWIEMPDKNCETRGQVWNGMVKPITVLPNQTPKERLTPFILGYYDDKKKFQGLDTAWVHQEPSAEIVEIPDSTVH